MSNIFFWLFLMFFGPIIFVIRQTYSCFQKFTSKTINFRNLKNTAVCGPVRIKLTFYSSIK
jgi:hypothetical protein